MRDSEAKALKRAARDLAGHQMTVLHDDGLYRHLAFRNAESGWNLWFDLITVPGALIFQGDGESYVFRRLEDMFRFFRGPVGRINPDYWGEKIVSGPGRDAARHYDQDMLAEFVTDDVNEKVAEDPEKFARLPYAVQEVIDNFVGDESIDRESVERFKFWVRERDEYVYPPKDPDFQFTDVWEWTVRDYDWWFLWSLHAIVWGIAKYDGRDTTFPSAPESPAPETPPVGEQQALIDVHLPGDAPAVVGEATHD